LALRTTLIVIAFLLLAAHFMREATYVSMAICLAAPLLLIIKKPWALISVQLLAFAGAVLWIGISIGLVHQRMMLGKPWSRLVIILGAVTLFTVVAGALLSSNVARDRYR
jgi:hypothetical protein